MFSANIKMNTTYPSVSVGGNITLIYYEADYFVYVMGCTDQYQICNAAEPGPDGEATRYTPLGQFGALPIETINIGLKDCQYDIAATLGLAMRSAIMFYAVYGRGSSALMTAETVFSTGSRLQVAQIPNNR
jgi:hypothetical protein